MYALHGNACNTWSTLQGIYNIIRPRLRCIYSLPRNCFNYEFEKKQIRPKANSNNIPLAYLQFKKKNRLKVRHRRNNLLLLD